LGTQLAGIEREVRMNAKAILIVLSAALAGCGGSSDVPANSAAGLFERNGSAAPADEVLVLDSGRSYVVYGMNAATPVPAQGVIVLDIATTGGNFASSNVHDFDLPSRTLSMGSASGSFTAQASIAGTVTHTGGATSTFAGTYSTTYEQSASLSALAGSYGGETADLGVTQAAIVTLDPSGALAGSMSGGCSYVGLVSPHGAGNVFDVTATFRTGCTEDGRTFRGHAFVSRNVLYLVTLSGDLSRIVFFAGLKS